MNDDFKEKLGVLYKYDGKEKIVNIPFGPKIIGYGAFNFCDFIEEINIPNSVEEIQGVILGEERPEYHGAFDCCKNLKKSKYSP